MFPKNTILLSAMLISLASPPAVAAVDLARWVRQPQDWKGADVADGKAVLTADAWSSGNGGFGSTSMASPPATA